MNSPMHRGAAIVLTAAAAGVVAAGGYFAYRHYKKSHPPPPPPAPIVWHPAAQTKTSGCKAQGALSDPACTPGAIFQDATKDKICMKGYSASVRNVSTAEKNAVFKEYGIASHAAGQYEIDHLISLELGGSNNIANLWPEAAKPAPGFHEKDKIENLLHAKVCAGTVTLNDAQHIIATHWLSASP